MEINGAIRLIIKFLLYLIMQKNGANNKPGKKRVLATKKAASASPKSTVLKFKHVPEDELKVSRNSAYTYLVK
jgi:hypothetical protein